MGILFAMGRQLTPDERARRLAEAKEKLGWTQSQVARAIDTSDSNISNLCKRETKHSAAGDRFDEWLLWQESRGFTGEPVHSGTLSIVRGILVGILDVLAETDKADSAKAYFTMNQIRLIIEHYRDDLVALSEKEI